MISAKQDVLIDKPSQIDSKKYQVTLIWEYDNPDRISGFEIERRRGSDEQFKLLDTIRPNETSYTDTGLMPETTYYYRMRAYTVNSKSYCTSV